MKLHIVLDAAIIRRMLDEKANPVAVPTVSQVTDCGLQVPDQQSEPSTEEQRAPLASTPQPCLRGVGHSDSRLLLLPT